MWTALRVTQLYASGGAIYLYYGFITYDFELWDSLKVLNELEKAIRQEVLRSGGAVSHHHGVGKKKKHLLYQSTPRFMLDAIVSFKKNLDPKNIFAANNTYFFTEESEK